MANSENVEKRVKRIISEQLMVDEVEVTPSAKLRDDLDADSLDCVELTMQFEEEFNIEIPDDDADRLQTVQEFCDYIGKRV